MEKSVCLRAVAEATDDFREAQALVAKAVFASTSRQHQPLPSHLNSWCHVEENINDPFWDIFFSLSKYKINTV